MSRPARGSAGNSFASAGKATGKRPRLLIVGPRPPPLGGVQLVIDMQMHSRLARDFDLHLVDTSKRQLRWAVENLTWKTPLYFVRDSLNLLRALVRVRPDVSLIHAAAGFSFLRDWVFMLIARLARSKVVCHYHGTLHTNFPSGETRSGRLIGRCLMAVAHRVIVLSPGYRQKLSKAWCRNDIVWAPNMVDIDLFNSTPGDAPAPWLERGDRPVLFVGRLSAPKGIYDLFDAIPEVIVRHPRARFVLVGVAESDELEAVVRKEAARRGAASRISFLGALEGCEKVAAFASSLMIVVPSWTEGFPLVIPEAMAVGLPVISTAVGAIPDFVEDGKDGFLIPAYQPSLLADRICRLLDDEGLRKRIGDRVRTRAPREFSVEVGCTKVSGVVSGLLKPASDKRRAQASHAPADPPSRHTE